MPLSAVRRVSSACQEPATHHSLQHASQVMTAASLCRCRATKKGLRQHPKEKWASLRTAYSAAFIVGMYATLPGVPAANATEARCFVRSQLGYIAGDNPANISYVVGFGTKWPQQVHHRDTACTLREAVDNECYDQCAPSLPQSPAAAVGSSCVPDNHCNTWYRQVSTLKRYT